MGKTSFVTQLPPAIAQAVERGATIVTGNQRTARSLRQAYDRMQRAAGVSAWLPPDILAWDSWTTKLWQDLLLEGHETHTLLSATQEAMVWRSIISDDRKNLHTLRSANSLAEQATTAWRLVEQYSAQANLKGSAANFETRSYLRWADEFERRCKANKWISSPQLEGRLVASIQSGTLPVSRIFLVGFDELTPARRALLNAMAKANFVIDEEPALPIADVLSCVTVDDELEEVRAAARWARNSLQDYPERSIAVIVPSLTSKRPLIDRVFRQILVPELENITALHSPLPYEFSVGIPLTQTALIRVALDLLRWAFQPLPLEKVSSLLVSPLFGVGDADSQSRAVFDAFEVRQARMLLKPQVSIRWLLKTSSHARKRALPPRLIHALEALLQSSTQHGITTGHRGFGQWSDIFRDLLRQAQWQDGRFDNSVEFQARKRWESSLDELASLDFMGRQVGYGEALDALEEIAQATIFAPESRQTPVQILGPLEAAGASFDAIWFLGAGDLSWPAKHFYNPLLPASMQRNLEMPGEIKSDNRRDLVVARRICSSAATVILSYSSTTETGKMRLSPVLSSFFPETTSLHSVAPPDLESAPLPLTPFLDISIPPIAIQQTIPGGAEILRLQAACGFRAFAEKRLYSAELKKIVLGMDSMERGTSVHSALEVLWQELKSQDNLLAMSAENRRHAIDRAVNESIRRLHQHSAADWELAYIDIQRNRLKSLLTNWLEVEVNRKPFEVRLSEKEFKDVEIGPLRLSVRVDRVDQTESGDVIIDYKTGSARRSDWLTDRPDAPQLPLYAVISSTVQSPAQLADIAFAKVHAGNDALLDGYTGKTDSNKSIATRGGLPIAEQLQQWKETLTNLAEDFHHGDVRVDPKSYPHTCRYCAQRLLCRLDPTLLDVYEETNDAQEIE